MGYLTLLVCFTVLLVGSWSQHSPVEDFEIEGEEEERFDYFKRRAQEEKEKERKALLLGYSAAPWNNLRLPKDIAPRKYKIDLDPNLSTLQFQGSVEIELEVLAFTDLIVLHQNGLTISNVEVYKVFIDGFQEPVQVSGTFHQNSYQQFQIKVAERLHPRLTYLLKMKFSASLASPSQAKGFYYSHYSKPGVGRRYLATTQFEPTDARMAFPCFDEPSFKAKFTISMAHDSDYHALSNMPVLKKVQQSNGRFVSQFKESVTMSTYLVALIVCDYSYKEAYTSNGIRIRTWAPAHKVQYTEFALDVMKSTLPYFEQFFNQPYPMEKCDLIGIPHFWAGAMENWGLITYRESMYYYYPSSSSLRTKESVAKVVVHELAHQWFGNLVTMNWWNDLWLNEGYASFMENIGVHDAIPDWDMDDQFILNPLMTVMKGADATPYSHPLIVDVSSPSEIFSLFDSISYKKGASVSRMMMKFLGEETFLKGFKIYMAKHKYSNTITDNLWNAMKEATGNTVDVKAVMDTWTKQMGYPIVTVSRSGSTIKLKQTHFLTRSGTPDPSPFNYKWIIPLSYKTSNDPHSSKLVWMKEAEMNLPTSTSGWVKINLDHMGYYRVKYDDMNYRLIADQLSNDPTSMTAGDKANLFDDAFYLAGLGRLDMMNAFELTRYLYHETDYIPWRTASKVLGHVHDMILGTPSYPFFQKYMLKLIEPVMQVIGGEDTGSHVHRVLRRDILGLACLYGSQAAIADTKVVFNRYMQGQSLPSELAKPILHSGIREGGETAFNFMKGKYQSTRQSSYLYALASAKDQQLLKRLLEMGRDGQFSSSTLRYVIRYMNVNPYGYSTSWEFIQQNWQSIKQRYGSSSLVSFIREATKHFRSATKLQELKTLMATIPGVSEGSVNDAINSINKNIAWQNNNSQKIYNWLRNQV